MASYTKRFTDSHKLTGTPLPKSKHANTEFSPELKNALTEQRAQVAAFMRAKVK